LNKRLALLLVSGLSILALAACGSGGSEAEEEVDEAIITSITSTDPSKCTEVMTQRFVDQNADADGAEALKECEEEASDSSDDPDEVTVSGIEIDGSEATAEVAFVGGGFDGQTVAVALVEEGDQWKLDEIEGFSEYDAEALAQTLEDRFEAVSNEITPAQISCIGDAIRDTSAAEAEELLLGGDSEKFVEFAEACE
jgi:hypothetical protein